MQQGNAIGLADVFRAGFDSYVARQDIVPALHYKIANAIMDCRTEKLGGLVYRCDDCAQPLVLFHSCRNRHCPKCQAMARAAWVYNRESELPASGYFHVVFTIPPLLKRYALRNKVIFYSLMFRAASSSLLELGADPKYLGGTIGIIAILHTWTQTLTYHPHIHCLVPAGALAPDGVEWLPSSKRFLFPAEVLKKLYRGKLMHLFAQAVEQGDISVRMDSVTETAAFHKLLKTLYTTKWVVYLKESFNRPGEIVKYLASYINRIAIADKRIQRIAQGAVTFRYLDRKNGNHEKLMTIPVASFIARFFLHAVPSGFVRIRYYGLLANRNRTENMARCRAAVSGVPEALPVSNEDTVDQEFASSDLTLIFPRCSHCHSTRLTLTKEIPKRQNGNHLRAA